MMSNVRRDSRRVALRRERVHLTERIKSLQRLIAFSEAEIDIHQARLREIGPEFNQF
jgi:hypothetical protein